LLSLAINATSPKGKVRGVRELLPQPKKKGDSSAERYRADRFGT